MLSVEERQEAIPERKVIRAVALSVSMSYKEITRVLENKIFIPSLGKFHLKPSIDVRKG
jgi:hypothetical protein